MPTFNIFEKGVGFPFQYNLKEETMTLWQGFLRNKEEVMRNFLSKEKGFPSFREKLVVALTKL